MVCLSLRPTSSINTTLKTVSSWPSSYAFRSFCYWISCGGRALFITCTDESLTSCWGPLIEPFSLTSIHRFRHCGEEEANGDPQLLICGFSLNLTASYWKQEMSSEEKSSIMSQKISSPSHSNSSSSSKHDSRQVRLGKRKVVGMWNNFTVCFKDLQSCFHSQTCLHLSVLCSCEEHSDRDHMLMPDVNRALDLGVDLSHI